MAPHPHAIASRDRIESHARNSVAQYGRAAVNPYEPYTDHHTIWQAAADAALAEQVEGQGA